MASTALPPWMTTAQVADYFDTDRTDAYNTLLQQLDVRRIGVRSGCAPWGRLIRVERSSVLQLRGQPTVPDDELPRWVTLLQAGNHSQVSPHLVRRMIAHEQLDARRIGNSRSIRIDRTSLLNLGRIRIWSA